MGTGFLAVVRIKDIGFGKLSLYCMAITKITANVQKFFSFHFVRRRFFLGGLILPEA